MIMRLLYIVQITSCVNQYIKILKPKRYNLSFLNNADMSVSLNLHTAVSADLGNDSTFTNCTGLQSLLSFLLNLRTNACLHFPNSSTGIHTSTN
jgi:hypothetical protein